MSAKTYVQTVNAVLRRLREAEVSSVSERAYSALIGDFVNQAKREVENYHYWKVLYTYYTLALVSGTQEYTLTGWGTDFRLDHLRNETENRSKIKPSGIRHWAGLYPEDKTGRPDYWIMSGNIKNANGDTSILFWPTPDASYTVRAYAWLGQGDISTDTVYVKVPSLPVVLRAYALAIQERGEDVGVSYSEADERAQQALLNAVEQESESQANGQVPYWAIG